MRISEGDQVAFTHCYAEYGKMLRPFLVKLIGTRDGADEIIQEVFLKVWLHRDRLAGVESPRSWVFRVAANTGRNWLKKQLTMEVHMRAQQGTVPVHDHVTDRLDMHRIADVVQETVGAFPPQRKLIYQMSREEGLKPGEIAARLEISVSTVKNTLLSALKAIRENIEQAGLLGTLLFLFIKR
ncbi:sigma-70 family RNA polymerase sigma factor [Flavitalea sp. BT771]|uniref:RNA polymerase sigma factor n=1 Tax=Flavitalea sp. BT771 TaxID=3063329 RepID=UPI0026E3675C|nr:sigma-70 family RNA polymerase sigma factor [Flavitalea sp. BT771]MDO6432343.1 sigma-70 family RNA polymerase sigma factor [Flavitalea sp. BT771]MDV6221253.1 sigma-70 family RNA polymerase sigma factor [Flavitalea sp. BT771]